VIGKTEQGKNIQIKEIFT